MTVALYCRVSTDEQAKEGFSLDAQKEVLTAYCKVRGWDDYKFFVDDGYTGSNIERPGLKRVLYAIQRGQIEHVVVMKLDRLSRSQKDTLYLIEDVFQKHSVGFHSTKESLDTSSPMGKLMIGILSSFAQFERETLIERVTMGRRQRFNQGIWYGGRVPFGYDWDIKAQRLVINPSQAALVKEVYRRYLQGGSLTGIGEWLQKRTRDRKVTHAFVRDMLDRPIYTGRMVNAGKTAEGNHDPIIDEKTWQSVQHERQRRREGLVRPGKYLLSGLLRCGLCGSIVMHIKYKKGAYEYHYYMCDKKHRAGRNSGCSLRAIQTRKLEDDVIQRLREVDLQEKDFKKRKENLEDGKNVREELEQKLRDIEDKIERWSDAFEAREIDANFLNRRLRKLTEDRDALELRLDELETPSYEDRTEDVVASLRSIRDGWDALTFEEQSIVLHAAVRKITLYPDHMEIEWNV